MIFIQYKFRLVDIQIIIGPLLPWSRAEIIQIGPGHRVFGRGRINLLETPQLLLGNGQHIVRQITYNPMKVSYPELLHLFLRSIDPTDAGGQFCDRGDSYRTAIFPKDSAQKDAAKAAIATAQAELGRKIVTPVKSAGRFYKADSYHQDYYKGKELVLTRNGPKSKASAYKFYRKSCGRDAKVKALWGADAPFLGH